MKYQRVNVKTGELIGEPDGLPDDLVGLSDATLADLSASLDPDACEALGYTDQGFLLVADAEAEAAEAAEMAIAVTAEAIKVVAAGLFTDEEQALLRKAVEILIAKAL